MRSTKPVTFLLFLISVSSAWCTAPSDKPLLLRDPTISRTRIAFTFANDIWCVTREGGDAVRSHGQEGQRADRTASGTI